MTVEMLVVYGVIVLALVLFVSDRYPIEQVALGVPVVLMAARVIDPEQAVAGLASPATVTVGAMLVLGLGLTKTGAVDALVRWARTAPRDGPALRLFGLCALTAAVSPFLNNTAVVVVFLPVFLEVARHVGEPPSRFLIPLSYSAILGGTVTLIGTSTNLVVDGLARSRGYGELGIFSLAPLGVVYLGVGMLYLFTAGRRLLPSREGPLDLSGKYDVRSFLTELEVEPGSPVVGHTLEALRWGELYGVSVVGIQRGPRTIAAPEARRTARAGDILLVQGDTARLLRLAREQHLATPSARRLPEDAGTGRDVRLVELLVAPGSPLAGSTLRETRFQQRYGAVVVAIQHHGVMLHERLPDRTFEAGDILLVHGPAGALDALADERGFVPLGEVERQRGPRPRAIVAVLIMVGVVGAAASGLVTILPAALAGVVLMLFTGCVRIREVYEELDWSVVFLLAGLIPLGIAMDASGAAEDLASRLAALLSGSGPVVAVALVYVTVSILTEVMSNTAAAVVLTPVALRTAADLGMNPYALLVAVMFGASASFMTPVGYQTNTLVLGPGGYRFSDFLRVGAPLNLILLVTASLLIPVFWPS